MVTRFIIKTHTEGLRPGLFSIIIDQCTSPDRGSYPEHVSKRAADILLRIGKKREAAAKFAVLAAWRNFGFLLENMSWSWRATTIRAVLSRVSKTSSADPITYYTLTPQEKVMYLRYYLESDGAMLISFSKMISQTGSIQRGALYNKFPDLMKELYDAYVAAAKDHREKVRIQERLAEVRKQLKARVYDKDTLPHKVLPHLQAMEDLGLVTCETKDGESYYRSTQVAKGESTQILIDSVHDPSELEQLIIKGNPYAVISSCQGVNSRSVDLKSDATTLNDVLMDGYSIIKRAPTGMAPISGLVEWTCAIMLSEFGILVPPQEVRNYIDTIWKENPSAVRFHVDYSGNKAYVIFAA